MDVRDRPFDFPPPFADDVNGAHDEQPERPVFEQKPRHGQRHRALAATHFGNQKNATHGFKPRECTSNLFSLAGEERERLSGLFCPAGFDIGQVRQTVAGIVSGQ